MKFKSSFIALFVFVSGIIQAQTPESLQSVVERIISEDSRLKGTVVGVKAVTESGKTLVDINSDKMLIPASNVKLITTGITLDKLSGDFRFRTDIAYKGEICDSVLVGDIIIIGGADPTLGVRYDSFPAIDSVFAAWRDIIKSAGIARIDGKITADASYIGEISENPGWEISDVGTYYGAGVCGVQFFGNAVEYSVKPGQFIGDTPVITRKYPATPWMKVSNESRTGEKGTGDKLEYYTLRLSDKAVWKGTVGVDRKEFTVRCANKHPDLTCAREFSNFLSLAGIGNKGYAGAENEDPVVLGGTVSPELRDIVRYTNFKSDNVFAETLLRVTACEVSGDSDYNSAIGMEQDALELMGLDTDHRAFLRDGSGLSAHNRVSPAFFCDFLCEMMQRPCWNDFYNSLPRAGLDGTVSGMLKNVPYDIRSRVHMKSGGMDGVRSFSGYYMPSDGQPVIFSVIANGCGSTRPLTGALDDIIREILGCGVK